MIRLVQALLYRGYHQVSTFNSHHLRLNQDLWYHAVRGHTPQQIRGLLHFLKRQRVDASRLVVNAHHYHATMIVALCHHLAAHVVLVLASHPLLELHPCLLSRIAQLQYFFFGHNFIPICLRVQR